jgi:APA family basic amino acid/polyamine antiporter
MVVGGMIGSGIFVMPAQLAPYGWTSLPAWGAAIVGALLLAFVLSKLAAARPEATGTVAVVGAQLGPLAGVLVGWAYWVSVWSAISIIAVTAVRYLATFVPVLAATPLTLALWSCGLVWLLTLLNLAGARAAGNFQVVTTLLKLLPLLAVVAIIIGFAMRGGGQFVQYAHAPWEPAKLTGAVTLAFYALVGFESAGVVAERIRDPGRNVLRATMIGTALTGLLYVIMCSGIIFAMPPDVIANAPAPVALFVEVFFGRGAGLAVAAFAVIATVGCLNGWVLIQGELPLGMARAGLLPRWMATTNRHDVSVRLLCLGSTCANILILSSAAGSSGLGGLLDFMLNLTAATSLLLYLGACLAALRLGVVRGVAGLGLLFCLWAMWGSGTAALLAVALMLTAIPLYLLRPVLAEQPA